MFQPFSVLLKRKKSAGHILCDESFNPSQCYSNWTSVLKNFLVLVVSTLLSATQTQIVWKPVLYFVSVSTLLSATQTKQVKKIKTKKSKFQPFSVLLKQSNLDFENRDYTYVSTLLSATQTAFRIYKVNTAICFNPSKCYSNMSLLMSFNLIRTGFNPSKCYSNDNTNMTSSSCPSSFNPSKCYSNNSQKSKKSGKKQQFQPFSVLLKRNNT